VVLGRSGAVRSSYFVNGFLKEREALRDDLRHATCRTRLSSSHFLCCRSAI